MTPIPTAGEYYQQLHQLLVRCHTGLTDEQQRILRTVVRTRRNCHRSREQTPMPAAISRQATEILQLLEDAARDLRPRETQELDDLVAGKEPTAQPANYDAPVRPHRRRHG